MNGILQFFIGVAMLIATRFSVGSHGASVRVHRRYWGVFFTGGWPSFRALPVIAGGSDALSSQGTYISFDPGASPTVFTEVGEVSSISGPTPDSEEIDVTHLRSTGGFREYLQSFKDGGEISVTANYLPGNASQDGTTGVRSLFLSGAVNAWKVTLPDGSDIQFNAYVKSVGMTASVGAKLEFPFTLRVTGAPSFNE